MKEEERSIIYTMKEGKEGERVLTPIMKKKKEEKKGKERQYY